MKQYSTAINSAKTGFSQPSNIWLSSQEYYAGSRSKAKHTSANRPITRKFAKI